MGSSRAPAYRRHKQSGQAIVTLPNGLGARSDVLLGKYGSAASRIHYERVIAEWEANGRVYSPRVRATDRTINELLLQFWRHAEEHYRDLDGNPTSEIRDYKLTLRPLKHFYGTKLVSEFGPLSLKAVRQKMIEGWEHPDRKIGIQVPLSRGVINQRINRIRRVFRWGVENELVPESILNALDAVKGLQAGRSGARETKAVTPVAIEVVEKTLVHLHRHLAGMVRLQLLTGARPGEISRMRACDIDVTGDVWLYRPPFHKTAYKGMLRLIALGPQAQEIVKQFLKLDTQAYLFSPADARTERYAALRANRKTPVQPSQRNRKKSNPKRKPGGRYHVSSYCKAIAKACKKASMPHWHPHQLRHTRATELRRKYGLDAARAILGHRSPTITETYAELDATQATNIMREIG